ncbi:glutamate synthase domain-containing protein 2 [Novosphingobium capsulatum]|uniref:Glutamate synthase domain-containing protein 2 n=1 Tax=Novosphingobium capsulatum TaxID=13688 RepID=A0ABU1MNP0_9SPHN|nr:FMN-binding glutamate synthase family protein [Novosphingobium capsulatum]MDR6511946.1 glutamate synthase domain-containing protein 2 [Novosphingobium capsulatum]
MSGRPTLTQALWRDHALSRNVLLFGALAGTIGTIAVGWDHPGAWWLLLLFLPLLLITVIDLAQTHHSLRRNYPGSARLRWFFEWLRPFLRSYIVESDLDGRPFSHDERALVYARAKGDVSTHPFGTELDVYSEEYEWLAHSIAPTRNAERYTRVTVGTDQCSRPYQAARLNISAMSFGALSANAIEALNLGARIGGFYHDTGEGGLSPYHLKHGGDVVWEIGSGYFGCRDAKGDFHPEHFRERAGHDAVVMTEIKLSQGAKPGHGGLLPGAKVTAEIAKIRDVPEGEDCLSPAYHTAFSTPRGLLEFAARMRDLSGGKPVGIKLCVGYPHELFAVVKAMVETEILLDFIVIDGAEGGTGAAPTELSDRVGMPLREGLMLASNALVGTNLKGRVKLAASGKVNSGAAIAMNAALGADWCNAARPFMFSLGCVQSLRCHTDTCPTGIATQSLARQRGLVVPEKAERVARFQKATLDALHDIVVAAGLSTPDEFTPDSLRQRINASEMRSFDELYPFVAPGELLDGARDPRLAAWWRQADPESFARRA